MTRTSAGTLIRISAAAPNTFDEAGYGAVEFTKIGKIETADGDFGRLYDLVTFEPLDSRGTEKLKGGYNEGNLTLQVALVETDGGQVIAEEAAGSDEPYYFEIEFKNGKKRWFPAIVMGFRERIGGRKDITRAMISLELTTDDNDVGIVKSA